VTSYYDKIREEQKEFNLEALMRRMVIDFKYPGHKVAWIDVNKWDEIWRREKNYYIERGRHVDICNRIGRRYERVIEFFHMDPVERHEKFGPIKMPRAKVDVRGKITMGNGRHRYAVMRDFGAVKIPISMDDDSLQNAERVGYLI
jgi:hypothetical protein